MYLQHFKWPSYWKKSDLVLSHLTFNLKPLKAAKTTNQPVYSLINTPSSELKIVWEKQHQNEIILNGYCSFRGLPTHKTNHQLLLIIYTTLSEIELNALNTKTDKLD